MRSTDVLLESREREEGDVHNAQRAVIGGLTETGLVAAGDGEQQATIANQQASSAMAANCKLIVIVLFLQ